MRLAGKSLKKWILGGLCIVSVVLTALPADQARQACYAVRPVLAPLSAAGGYVARHLRSRLDEMVSPPGREDEKVVALRQQILFMQRMLERQREQIRTLTKWDETLKGFTCKLLPARVVGAEPLPLRNRRLIDAGGRGGVRAGDTVTTRKLLHESPTHLPDKLTVLGRNYVVGCIENCASHTATLKLVTDPHFRTPAKLWRLVAPGQEREIYIATSSGGMEKRTFRHSGRTPGPEPVGGPIPVEAAGDGRGVVLSHVPANHGVCAGDILTSDESAGFLPLGLAIGRVNRVVLDKKDAHFVTVFVAPLADLDRLRDVYVVLPYRPEEAGE